jgi:hypothetical protein
MAAGSLIAGAPYLLLEGSHGSPGRMPVPSLRETGTHIRAQLMLRSEGKGILRVRLEIRGAEGWAIAENIRTQNANTRRLIGPTDHRPLLPRLDDAKRPIPRPRQQERPLTIELELTRNRYVQERGSRKELPPLPIPSRMKARYASRSERQYPFISPALDVATYELRIDPGPHRFARRPAGPPPPPTAPRLQPLLEPRAQQRERHDPRAHPPPKPHPPPRPHPRPPLRRLARTLRRNRPHRTGHAPTALAGR